MGNHYNQKLRQRWGITISQLEVVLYPIIMGILATPPQSYPPLVSLNKALLTPYYWGGGGCFRGGS